MLWVILLLAIAGYFYLAKFYGDNVPETFKEKFEKMMLVISHPDDEVMFFGPTLCCFLKMFGKGNIYILCITSGNYYGDGVLREKELLRSCALLGIPQSNVTLLQESQFVDDPTIEWNEFVLSDKINETCLERNIDLVLTFSSNGVSGHQNHIQTYNSVLKLNRLSRLFLCDVNIARKYSSVLDVFTTMLCDQWFGDGSLVFISSLSDVFKTYKAMCCHASQLVWFRRIYFLFSRYILVNHLRLCEPLLEDIR